MKPLKLFLLIYISFLQDLSAQKSIIRNPNNASGETPGWIQMMEDSTANYFDAVKLFDDFWKDRVKPIEANDNDLLISSDEEKREHKEFEKQLQRMSPTDRNNYEWLCYQYKRFINWMNESKPFIHANGHVSTLYEQKQIWEIQQKNR